MRLGIDDLDLVHSIMKHPDVFPYIKDDRSPSAEDFSAAEALASPVLYFLNPAPGCLFIFYPFVSSTMFEGHTCVVPESRGRVAIQAGKDVIQWMFSNTACEKIVGFFAEDNRRALLGANHMGLRRTHVVTGGMRRDGQKINLVMVEVDK